MDKALRYNEGKLRFDLVPLDVVDKFIKIGTTCPSIAHLLLTDVINAYQRGEDTYMGHSCIEVIGFKLLELLEKRPLVSFFDDAFHLSENSLELIAEVFTMGAKKYAPHNWTKGASWSETLGSLLRHYRKWTLGQEKDEESGIHHLAHAIVNAIFLHRFYDLAPWFDDRIKSWLIMPKIILDIDDVVADFLGAYKTFYNLEKPIKQWHFSYKTQENLVDLKDNKEFWVNMPVLHRPNFIPHAYVSSREVPITWTMEFLEKNDLPCRPVYHLGYQDSKLSTLQSLDTQIFIDDKFANVVEAQRAGITSFLMNNDHNTYYDVGRRRIHSLDIKEIFS